MLATWKLAPCLAAGCTVVLKPAELSPLSASLLPEIMEEAGLPAGVFNIVHGVGEDAGAALVAHPDVPVISFTGETTTGKTIMARRPTTSRGCRWSSAASRRASCSPTPTSSTALDSALFGVFSLNGERCTAGSRVLVERSIYDEFVERLAERAAAIRVGDPADPATEVGALISDRALRAGACRTSRPGSAEGARLVAGGGRPEHLPTGNYLAPTVFADVTPAMRIFREEIFGPVVCVTPFDDEAEAIALANDTRYGLAAYVWTNDLRRGHRLGTPDRDRAWCGSTRTTCATCARRSAASRRAGSAARAASTASTSTPTRRIVHVALGDTHVPRFGVAVMP